MVQTRCGLCGGDGRLETVAVAPPVVTADEPATPELSPWPFLVPAILFGLFFLFLWL
jgi:hypothetical protein